ncbi:MAG: hypothetical protein LBC40_03170, partial [Dysgonamonadaceae bacterium]|nr:hypothetical protein [Dysgonamonadaceae bacterium]
KDRLQALPIRAFNLNDKEVICDVDYRIVRLSAGQVLGKNLDENDWKEEATVASGTFSTRDSLRLTGFRKMPSGKYRLFLQTKDDKGREIIEKQDFMLYSFQDKRPPVVQYEWLVAENTTCAPGENVEILYGSSAENAYVLFELYQNGKNLERKRFVLNNENKKLIIPFKASYGNGVSVTFTFIKDAQLFTEALIINRKQEDKSLRLKMDVFRNKLLPGQTEEWKLSVRDAHGKPVPSEVLANMYDFSLDKIYRNDWYFYPASIFYRNDPPVFYADGAFMNGTASFYIDKKSVDVPEFAFDAFNWFGLDFHSKMLYSLRSSVSMDNAAGAFLVRGNAPVQKENLTEVVMHVSEETARQDNATKHASQEPEMTPEPVLIRGNFNETAFFYPQLRTNDAGETVIAFTVPESNTAWKFRTLAHTKDAGYGSLTEQVVTRKPLMVAPNMPRFVRWGDNITLTTNISNASDSLQSGKIQIELLDPQTEKPLIIPAENIRAFSIEKGQTAAISWSFHIPGKIDLLTCKIIARSEHFSDGEQHILPVLPNRLQVTESLPLPISGKGDKQFTFDKLLHDTSTTAENYRLTLEFASNPAWYAIQALHAMGTPQDESVISWFSAYYTNSLATSIANRTPKIKQIIDSWNRQTGTVDTFRSNLEKNPELKTVLSEETPWVLDASNETEQKQRLSLLFDANRNRYLVSEAVGKLKEIQLEDGGWSWFKGMYSTIPVTHWILYGLGQLERLNALQQQDITGEIQRKALSFIDREFKKSFENLKKSNPNYAKLQIIGNYALEYLYVRSFYPDISPEGTEEALAFYLDLIDKYWSKTGNLYQRALAAMILQRNGRAATAAKIAQSLREHATRKPETGMYWANNSPHCFYFQSAVSVHTFIMQALTETGVSQEDTDAMKLWLLKQKQTQRWESTPATVNAIYALLNTGSDWLNSEGQTDIRLGKQTIRTDNGEAGTGYIKKVFHASEIQPDMGNIAVSKHDDGPAYGALYRQYYEDMDKITQAGNNLRIDKKLFVEKISETNRIIVPATDSEPVSVGDKVIVRLTVRVDNDMEYLALKDVRAACFEPVEQVSGIQWKESVAYYRTNRDASTCFYFDHLPKGTHVFEYALYATRPGEYFGGITTIQCLYAPEFTAHTEGRKLRVRRKD